MKIKMNWNSKKIIAKWINLKKVKVKAKVKIKLFSKLQVKKVNQKFQRRKNLKILKKKLLKVNKIFKVNPKENL